MLQLPEDRRPPITPQMAVRVAVLGGLALVLFAVIFFRLWYLQVLSGDKYLAQANDNRVRDITVAAPRGNVVDRNGTLLVDNRVGIAVQIEPQKLPSGAKRKDLFRRLGAVIGMSPARITQAVHEQRILLPYANVTLKTDVPRDV
jgi:penicillin-binding protein 2